MTLLDTVVYKCRCSASQIWKGLRTEVEKPFLNMILKAEKKKWNKPEL